MRRMGDGYASTMKDVLDRNSTYDDDDDDDVILVIFTHELFYFSSKRHSRLRRETQWISQNLPKHQ
jgi:hypothetical protein